MRRAEGAKGIIFDVISDGSDARVEVSIFLPDVVAKKVMHTLQVTFASGDKRGH